MTSIVSVFVTITTWTSPERRQQTRERSNFQSTSNKSAQNGGMAMLGNNNNPTLVNWGQPPIRLPD